MTVTAELADGRRLEFPDGTDPAVVQATVKRLIAGAPTAPAPKPTTAADTARNFAGALIEPGLHMASSLVAKPMGEMAGIKAVVQNLITGGDTDPEQAKNNVQNFLTYSPRTEGGREVIESPFNPINAVGNVVGKASDLQHGFVKGDAADFSVRGMVANGLKEAGLQALGFMGLKVAPKLATVPSRTINTVADAAMNVKNHLYPSPGYIANRAAGDLAPNVIRELSTARPDIRNMPMTPGQAAVGANSAEFSALQTALQSRNPSLFSGPTGVQARQAATMRGQLESLAGGGSQEAAITARGAEKGAFRQQWLPLRDVEIAAADTAGTQLPKLQGKADALGEAAASKVADVRRMANAERIANEMATRGNVTLSNTSNPPATIGMPRIGTGVSYPAELAGRADAAGVKAAADSLPLGEGARFAQMQADSLAAHGLRPIDSAALKSRIGRILDDPSIAGNAVAENSVQNVIAKIDQWAAKNGGVPSAEALHSIRKNAVESVVRKEMMGASDNAVKAATAGMVRRISPAIDDAIVAAGGTQWRAVLDSWAKKMHQLERREMGAELMRQFDKNPQGVVAAARGNAPELVESVFGPGRVSMAGEMGPKMGPVRKVAAALERDAALADLAKAGGQELGRRVAPLGLPPQGFFSPPIAAARSIINRAMGSGMERGLHRLAPYMTDAPGAPQALAKMMQDATPGQRAVIESLLVRQAIEQAGIAAPYAAQGDRNAIQR